MIILVPLTWSILVVEFGENIFENKKSGSQRTVKKSGNDLKWNLPTQNMRAIYL